MSKELFRWLRGELNGYYLTNINNLMNKYISNVKSFFITFNKMQFNTADMSTETIYNIGKFAGVFIPRMSTGEGYGSFRLTDSIIKNGEERSERGLYNRNTETFNFSYSEDETVDINTHATADDKSSLIGINDTVKGYIDSHETNVIDSDGNVIEDKVTATVPSDSAYSNFYGNQFLFLQEEITENSNINVTIFYSLYKVLQWIRYNGANIVSLCKLVEAICPDGLIKIISITKDSNNPSFVVKYYYDSSIAVTMKNQRLLTFQYIIGLKFPQFVLQESDTLEV